jgi:hypothetical protein
VAPWLNSSLVDTPSTHQATTWAESDAGAAYDLPESPETDGGQPQLSAATFVVLVAAACIVLLSMVHLFARYGF